MACLAMGKYYFESSYPAAWILPSALMFRSLQPDTEHTAPQFVGNPGGISDSSLKHNGLRIFHHDYFRPSGYDEGASSEKRSFYYSLLQNVCDGDTIPVQVAYEFRQSIKEHHIVFFWLRIIQTRAP